MQIYIRLCVALPYCDKLGSILISWFFESQVRTQRGRKCYAMAERTFGYVETFIISAESFQYDGNYKGGDDIYGP